jgi:hypothetical protein
MLKNELKRKLTYNRIEGAYELCKKHMKPTEKQKKSEKGYDLIKSQEILMGFMDSLFIGIDSLEGMIERHPDFCEHTFIAIQLLEKTFQGSHRKGLFGQAKVPKVKKL